MVGKPGLIENTRCYGYPGDARIFQSTLFLLLMTAESTMANIPVPKLKIRPDVQKSHTYFSRLETSCAAANPSS